MGINPNSGDGVEKNYTVDGRTDATSIVSDAEHTGNEAGKVFAHIAAQAESANKGNSDLSRRVAALEKASGPDLSGYATKSDVDAVRRHVGVFSGVTSAGSSRVNVPLSTKGGLPDGWEKGGSSVTLPAGVYRIEFWLGSTDELNLVGLTPSQNLTPPSNSRNDRNPAVLTTLTTRTSFYLRSLPTSGQELTMVVDRLA